MAMAGHTRRAAENAIASCRPFKNSTGSLTGTRGSTRELGWLSSHPDARRIKELLGRAVYVVWSYATPIGFVSEDEDGNRTAYYVDVTHSPTTANHQGVVRMGMGEYETIGSETRREREREARRRRNQPARRDNSAAIRESNEMVAQFAAARDRLPTSAHVYIEQAQQREARERNALLDRLAGRASDASLVGSPGYQNGLTEDQQADTLARLLDSRFADPNWVPNRDYEADLAAERRDMERVEREGPWTP